MVEAARDASWLPAVALLTRPAAGHFVQFYDDDEVLCDHVARYLADGLAAGEPVIAIATDAHRARFSQRLAALGHDPVAAAALGQLVMLDAHGTLAAFMIGGVGGEPARERFLELVGGALERLRGGSPGRSIRAYGEMVDVLWRAGNRSAALAVEALWGELSKTLSFSLLCAYVMSNFHRGGDRDSFDAVCAAHTGVVPVGERAELPPERAREIAMLQQRTRALEHEIAQRRELEVALRDALERERAAREDAERSLRFNEQFAAMLGHDLRNPLGTIAIGASHIVASSESERVVRTASRIVASAARMARMVEQLLDATRLRTGTGLQLACQRVDLTALWRRTVDELTAAGAVTPAVTPVIAIDAIGDAAGAWDPDRLAQVASVLVHNAIVHGTQGRPISIVIDGSDPDTVVAIIHNAGAIAPDTLPVLFAPFRGTAHKAANARGLGLGLYLAQQIVEAHGGTLDVQSSEAAGTLLRVSLRRALPDGAETCTMTT